MSGRTAFSAGGSMRRPTTYCRLTGGRSDLDGVEADAAGAIAGDSTLGSRSLENCAIALSAPGA
jgi:hypothetical protein